MRNLIVIILVLLVEISICIYFYYRSRKETKELRNRLEKETKELRSRLEKENEDMERIANLFLEDMKMFVNDDDFKKWRDRILNIFQKRLYEIVLKENNDEASNEFYCILKEYEEWRTQKLR